MPAKQGTTSPGEPSQTHGRFGQRRTAGNLDSFVQPDLSYVERGNNAVGEDAAAQIRSDILNGNVQAKDKNGAPISKSSELAYMKVNIGDAGDSSNHPLKYNYVKIEKFGPNLKPPIKVTNGVASIDKDKDIAKDSDTLEIIGHELGNMKSDNSDNRKSPYETSSHPRGNRPTFSGSVLGGVSGVTQRAEPARTPTPDLEPEDEGYEPMAPNSN